MLLGKKPLGTIAYLGGVMALPEPFVWSWTQMMQYNAEFVTQTNEYIHYDRATVSYHSFARNTLVEKMRGEWLLMLDVDHKFDPDLVARMILMMDKHKIDVLSGIYQFKSPPHMPVMYLYNEETKGNGLMGKWDNNVDLFEIGSSGAGCLMVRRSVFEKIKMKLKENPFDISEPYSEDHSFFHRLRKLKIKAYCSPKIFCNHLVIKEITINDYDTSGLVFSKVFTREALIMK